MTDFKPLIAKAADGTDLQGTTWYQNRMEPYFYWRFFSDAIIHKIHERVLAHIKTVSENDVATELRRKNFTAGKAENSSGEQNFYE